MSSLPDTAGDLTDRAPRWGTPRRPERPTRGTLDAAVAALLGWSYFPWQTNAANVAGEYDPTSKLPMYRTVGISVSRQNGKTTLVLSRIARQLIAPGSTVAYTAQDRGVAVTKWTEHVDLLLDTPFADRVARVDRTDHREILVMANRSRYLPVTPSAKAQQGKRANAGRSLSIDLAVLDEAHAHETTAIVDALKPAMAARAAAQIWLLSNAGDANSGLWRHYTELGRTLAGDPNSPMCWIEHAADPHADTLDRRAWLDGNPSLDLPGGVSSAALADAALTLDADAFRREHLNVWVDGVETAGIDPVAWAACRDDELAGGTERCIALDFTPERDRGALVGAGDVDGRTTLEVLEAGSDLDRLITRTIAAALDNDATVIIDRGGPAASAIPALEDAGCEIRLIPLDDYRRACHDFHDAVTYRRLAHRGDYRLTDAIAGASRRNVGEGWVWRRRGGADLTPLIAATLARWGVVAYAERQAKVW